MKTIKIYALTAVAALSMAVVSCGGGETVNTKVDSDSVAPKIEEEAPQTPGEKQVEKMVSVYRQAIDQVKPGNATNLANYVKAREEAMTVYLHKRGIVLTEAEQGTLDQTRAEWEEACAAAKRK